MKKNIVLIMAMFWCLSSICQKSTVIDSNMVFVRVKSINTETINHLKKYGQVFDYKEEWIANNGVKTDISMSWLVLSEFHSDIRDILKDDSVVYASYFSKNEKGEAIGITGLIYASVASGNTSAAITSLNSIKGVSVVGIIGYKQNVLKLLIDKTTANDLPKIQSQMEAMGIFDYVELGTLYDVKLQCVNDTYFGSQWNLNNTGQSNGISGIDIRFCAAKNITRGNHNVVVAVVDAGVERNHPDLASNIINGYDASGHNSNGAPVNAGDEHGTCCAGIIGAVDNNNIGVSGVAPQCAIMPCYADFSSTQIVGQLSESIDFAWQNGASVISDSWSGSNSSTISTAITNALTYGRNGLGCIVVFSSGNSDGNVAYPANSNPLILAVGAIDRCGNRAGMPSNVSTCDQWCNPNSLPAGYMCAPASEYGTTLDVVAPGSNVPTTDRQGTLGENTQSGTAGDYYMNFGGTSAAAPHVAGVAALVLSVNPCLTVQQVNDIIESTTQKVGGYNYQTSTGRLNGSWNSEVGYGLINAQAAVQKALNLTLQNRTETANRLYSSTGTIRAGSAVDPSKPQGAYIVSNGANVELKATQSITMEPGFIAQPGSKFLAHIAPFNGDCASWNANSSGKRDESEDEAQSAYTTNTVLNTLLEEAELSIFPNPSNGKFTIASNLSKGGNVEVFSIKGEKVFSYSSANSLNGVDIDISNRAGGIYLVKVSTPENVWTKRVVVE